jgi:hypothetical protein
MTVTNKQDTKPQKAGQDAQNNTEQEKLAKKRRTGAARRQARVKYGAPTELQDINGATPEKAEKIQERNGRAKTATGHKERADAAANVEASDEIFAICDAHQVALGERGTGKNAVGGAKRIAARLAVAVELAALSVVGATVTASLDDAALVSKRRDAILRILPGHGNAAARAKFGLHVPMRNNLGSSVRTAAQALLAGMRAMPQSRAARLLGPDERRLAALVKSLAGSAVASKKSRAASASRATERDVLNAALELFYDDFAANIGLVLEDDEVARVAALELIPRRPDQRHVESAPPATGGTTAPAQTAAAGPA